MFWTSFAKLLQTFVLWFASGKTYEMVDAALPETQTPLPPREREPNTELQRPVASSVYHPVTDVRNVTANFTATGSPAWSNQPGGMHHGTDFSAPQGSAVYLPFAGKFLSKGYYADAGRMGHYLMFTLDDGTEYYSGHLDNPKQFQPGEYVPAGTKIGVTNVYNHTHIQIRQNGQLKDFEQYERSRIGR